MKENYYALAVCILRNCTPEQAFQLLETGKKKRVKKGTCLDVVPERQKLREQGLSYKAIGEIYGMSKDGVYIRLKKAKKTGEKCIV